MQLILVEILNKIHALPSQFPERESDEFDAGYSRAKAEIAFIIKEYLLKKEI